MDRALEKEIFNSSSEKADKEKNDNENKKNSTLCTAFIEMQFSCPKQSKVALAARGNDFT